MTKEWKTSLRLGKNMHKIHLWYRTATQNIQKILKIQQENNLILKWAKYLKRWLTYPQNQVEKLAYEKWLQNYLSLGNSKLKQWSTTIHLLEWPKPGKLTIPNAGEEVEQQKLSFITGGDAKEYSHFGRWSGSFLQSEIYSDYTIQQSYSLLFTQMSLKILYSYKNLQKEYLQQLYS